MTRSILIILLCFSSSVMACNPADSTATVRVSRFHPAKLSQPVDSILVVKQFRHMYAYNKGKLLKVYDIRLGTNPIGPKHFKGDLRTPEGLYHIIQKNPYSAYHKSLRISYPNDADRKYARQYGKDTGGDVMIHGIANGHAKETKEWMKQDWTWGCIAITDQDVEELYQYVTIGAAINILP